MEQGNSAIKFSDKKYIEEFPQEYNGNEDMELPLRKYIWKDARMKEFFSK